MKLKRCIDVFISLTILTLLSPIILIVAILVKVNLGSPVIFKQERPGKNGEIFSVYKFRTMKDLCNKYGESLPDSERLTKFGVILRKLSLDEIPQLVNVIKGEMSLVGPRPLLVKYMPYFTEIERKRFEVTPGITGWAQVNGRNTTSWNQRFELDVWYVENWSIWLDFKILLLTLTKVFKSDGIVVDARSVMKNLDEERSENENVFK